MAALFVKAEPFNYQLHYSSKRRTIALQVSNGQVIVRAPAGERIEYVNSLIKQKQAWLHKHLQNAVVGSPVVIDWQSKISLPYLDHTVAVQCILAKQTRIEQQQHSLAIQLATRIKPERRNLMVKQLLQKWYKQQAENWFAERLIYWQSVMKLNATNMQIANWRAKWGYCNHLGEVGFNWRLVMAPAWVTDYVVVHELAHIRHLNHSSDFWQLVKHYYPRFTAAKSWLKHNAVLLQW